MAADSEVALENNPKITFVTSNKGQSLLLLKNYIYKCNKQVQKNIGYVFMTNAICDTDDKCLYIITIFYFLLLSINKQLRKDMLQLGIESMAKTSFA